MPSIKNVISVFATLLLVGCSATEVKECRVPEGYLKQTSEQSSLKLIQKSRDASHVKWTTVSNTSASQRVQFLDPVNETDIWVTTRKNMRLPGHLKQPDVQNYIQWYSRNEQYLNRLADRAILFYYYVLHEVIERGIPAEIALLPAVESSYDPRAKSPAGAVGLWQFMPVTAEHYGIKENWWMDGRRDVLASTEAALNYLQYLHDYFDGDWLLAVAAYNAGEGTVARAIEKNRKAGKPVDFWNLKLPDETRAYVPRLLALSELIKHPSKYDLALAPLSDTPYFEVVDTGGQIELAKAAELSGIDIEEIYSLNAGAIRWATDPDGPHQLLLPVQAAAQFRTTLNSLQNGDQLTWRRYEVVAGDTISKLAKRFNSNIRSIQQSNNLKSVRLKAGQTLLIPTALETSNSLVVAPERTSDIQQGEVSLENPVLIPHTLEAGDSLWSIARLYGVSAAQLVDWNGIDLISEVGIGEQVLVARNGYQQPTVSNSDRVTDEDSTPAKVKQPVPASVKHKSDSNRPQKTIQASKSHVIKKGENLYRISLKYGIKLQQLLDWNNLKLDSVIVPGQSLRVSK